MDSKAVRDLPEDRKKELASAGEVCANLRRVLDSRRLYERGHPALLAMLQELERRLRQHLGEFGELTLEVSSLSLSLGGKPVLQAERREESIAHGPYLDGVRTLSLAPQLTAEELAALVEIWHECQRGGRDDSQTFPTLVWEAGLSAVRTTSLDALAEGSEVEAALAELRAGRAPLRTAAPAAPPPEGGATAIEIDIGTRLAEAPLRTPLPELAAEDLRRLAAAVPMERDEAARRTLLGLAALAPVAGPEEFPRLYKAAQSLFTALVRDGLLQPAADLARALSEAARAEGAPPGRAQHLPRLLEALDSPDVLGPALAALEAPATAEAATALLRQMPSRAAATLLDELGRPREAAVRRRLLALLGELAPPRDLLEKRMAAADAASALDLLEVARALAPADAAAVRLKALRHKAAPVRKAALDSFGAKAVAESAAWIRPSAHDPDPTVRKSAIDLLVRAKDPQAAAVITELLDKAKPDDPEIRSFLAALGVLGGEVACLTLRRTFRVLKDPEIKAACALALAQAGDDYSRPLLEATAKKLFAPAVLKDACREALRRLERRKAEKREGP